MSKSRKPLTIRGRSNQTWLSIWINPQGITFKVSKKTDKGFETVDVYDLSADFLVYKLLESGHESVIKACRLVERLAEIPEEEPETETDQ